MTSTSARELEELAQDLVAGTKLFPVPDGGVLWSRRLRCLYSLSPSATFICCLLHEGLSPREAAAVLAGRAEISLEAAARSVETVLVDWNRVESVGLPVQSAEQGESIAALLGMEPAVPARHGDSRLLRLRGRSVAIRFSDPTLESLCRPAYEHLAEREEAASARITIDVAQQGREFRLELQGREVDRCDHAEELPPLLTAMLFWVMVAGGGYWMAVHAAAVQVDGRALLLPGGAGSGKTTLTAGLLHRDCAYLTDDCVLLDEFFQADGVATSLAVKESGVRLLSPLFPVLGVTPTNLRRDGKKLRYLPPVAGFSASRPACEVGWIVFPRYEPSQRGATRRLGPAEALGLLGPLATVPGEIDASKVGALVAWLSERPTVEILFPSLVDGVREVASACGISNLRDAC